YVRSTFISNTSKRRSRRLVWNNRGCWPQRWLSGPWTIFGMRGARLFVTQRFDRIEVGCAIRGVEPEADADGRADKKAGNGPAVGEDDIYLEPGCQQVAGDDSKN